MVNIVNAIIDVEDPRDAEDAVEERDGYSFAEKLRVRDYCLIFF